MPTSRSCSTAESASRLPDQATQRRSRACRSALLLLALLFHVSMLASWRLGYWNQFTFDSTATQGWRGWDFFAVFQAGHNAATGISIYESDNDRIDVVAPRYTPYRYLPALALTLGNALSRLPPLWALRIWVVIIEITLLGCAWASSRLCKEPWARTALACMWLAYTPFYLEIYLGQFSLVQSAFTLFIVSGCLGGRLALRHDAAWLASILIKPNAMLLAPAMMRLRRFRGLAVVGGVVGLTTMAYVAAYPAALPAILGNLASDMGSQLGNHGVRQLLYSVVHGMFPELGPSYHQWIQRVWVLIVVLVSLYVTMRSATNSLLLICLWTTSFFLLYHDVWEHHYVMLLPVYVGLYARSRSRWLLLLWGLMAIWTPYVWIDPQGFAAYDASMRWTPLVPAALDVFYHASKAVPALALWVYICKQLITRREPIRV